MNNQKSGALIANARMERGLTQKELAQALHISDTTVSKRERGVGFPDVSLLEPLTKALGLTLTELFRGERDTAAAPEEVESMLADAVGVRHEANRKRLFRALRIAAACLLVACLLTMLCLLFPAPLYKPMQGSYQSEMLGGHITLLSVHARDGVFVLYIDNREVNCGTLEQLDDRVYMLRGDEADMVAVLKNERTVRLTIPGLNNGEPMLLKRLSLSLSGFGNGFGDEAEYRRLLH